LVINETTLYENPYCGGEGVHMSSNATIGQVEVTRYIQSTVKFNSGNTTIWVDPFGLNDDLIKGDKADIILLTHEHGDHFNLDAINAVSKDNTILVCNNSGIEEKIKGNVSSELVVMKEGDKNLVSGINVEAVAGYNDFHPRNNGHDSFNIGFIFEFGGVRILNAGDTDLIEEFSAMSPLDLALLPIGNAGYTMDENDAAKAVNEMLKPGTVIPVHYGFATGGDPEKFKSLINSGINVEILDPLNPMKAG
jgi:L-ascorbate metabolism protein UlaG (beta-lactamase superfamily)|tara:strand:- start:1105 stop:1854 length:750 start_codon:yes stop_codon:yes gene_type:complete